MTMNYAQQNPYAAPQQHAQPSVGQMPARMEGEALVVANGAAFTQVCLKCGTTHALEGRHQKYMYVPMWARFFGPLIQIIFRKTSEFYLPICNACNANWKKWNLIAGVSWIPGLLLIFMGLAIGDNAGALFTLMGLLGLFVGLITTLVLRLKHIVAATKIDGNSTWLTRIHPVALNAILNPGTAAPAYTQQPQQQQPYAYQ
jgi:hypothetical protein